MGDRSLLDQRGIDRDDEEGARAGAGQKVDRLEHRDLVVRQAAIEIVDADHEGIIGLERRHVVGDELAESSGHRDNGVEIRSIALGGPVEQLVKEVVDRLLACLQHLPKGTTTLSALNAIALPARSRV